MYNLLQELAAAETHDNEAEWQRLQGKPIKYGDVIQVLRLYLYLY